MGSPVDDALDRLDEIEVALTTKVSAPMVASAVRSVAIVRSELQRLREERDAAHRDVGNVALARMGRRAFHAEAEAQRLREGLRELLGPNPNYDPDGQHDYGWENEPPKPFAPRWVRDKVDALLAAPAGELADARLIALAPELAALVLDMGEFITEKFGVDGWLDDGSQALLARLDQLGKEPVDG